MGLARVGPVRGPHGRAGDWQIKPLHTRVLCDRSNVSQPRSWPSRPLLFKSRAALVIAAAGNAGSRRLKEGLKIEDARKVSRA